MAEDVEDIVPSTEESSSNYGGGALGDLRAAASGDSKGAGRARKKRLVQQGKKDAFADNHLQKKELEAKSRGNPAIMAAMERFRQQNQKLTGTVRKAQQSSDESNIEQAEQEVQKVKKEQKVTGGFLRLLKTADDAKNATHPLGWAKLAMEKSGCRNSVCICLLMFGGVVTLSILAGLGII